MMIDVLRNAARYAVLKDIYIYNEALAQAERLIDSGSSAEKATARALCEFVRDALKPHVRYDEDGPIERTWRLSTTLLMLDE